ncbi:peptidase M76 family-domain-containing protein [Hypoxylon argillaceum]|nr:peptidase M76 family-domain-containing protein [Hypoxylon argillaceum]KAI1151399.1 peptidase M76 family-domain-containing protein [Nemania diffusa]
MASSQPTPTAPTSSQTQPSSSAPSSTPATDAPKFPSIMTNDPKRTGFDPNTQWWVNYFKIITGSITPEGVFHYRESRYRANEERDCRTCEKWRDWALQHSPTVVFLRQKIAALNGNIDSSNVVCARCPARLTEDGEVHLQSGGFDPRSGILICSNAISSQSHMEDTLAHEMVHAWDHLRWKMDWVGDKDLKHAACTEIRASMLSGECRWTKEAITRRNWTLTQQFQDCVRKRAVQSLLARPRCKDDVQAVKVVNQVWDSCFSDTRPFDEVYR